MYRRLRKRDTDGKQQKKKKKLVESDRWEDGGE